MSTSVGTKENPIELYPSGASPEYIAARNTLLKAEWELRDQLERVAEMRRKLPTGAQMKSYTFQEGPEDITQSGPIKNTTLADLAADGRSVVVWHMMFSPDAEEPCSMCAMVVDGINATAPHLQQHVNLGIIGKAPIEKLRSYAAKRGWDKVRFLSSSENDFNADMHLEHPAWFPDADQMPGMSVFKKGDDGVVRHVYTVGAHFDPRTERGADLMSPVWSVLDIIPEGRGNWYAGNDYIKLKA
jgi:predicted dithiol-disulfide oxidoreductase (DUF899 family)